MEFLRVVVIIILCFLFIPLVIIGNLLMSLNLSYNKESISENAFPIFEEIIDIPKEEADNFILASCEFEDELYLEGIVKIECRDIEEHPSKPFKSFFLLSIKEIYHKDYDCRIIDCYTQQENIPLIFLSQKTNNNLKIFFILVLGITLLILLAHYFLFEKKEKFLIFTGIIFIVFSFISLLIEKISKYFLERQLGGPQFADSVDILLGKSFLVFLIWLFLGILFILTPAIFAKIREEKNEKEPSNSLEQDRKKVIFLSQYIEDAKNKGYLESEIKKIILERGYTESDFENASRVASEC